MTGRYPGARIRLLEGSDHAISDFDAAPDDVLAFLRPRLRDAAERRAADSRMGQSRPCSYCSKKPANSWPAGCCPRPRPPQVELDSGKRVKVKAANVLLKFEKPAAGRAAARSAGLAADIELDLAWEFAPEERIRLRRPGARILQRQCRRWCSRPPRCLRLFEAPHYFRRAGKGALPQGAARDRAAALAAIEKKKQLQAQIGAWAAELVAGSCPAAIREQLYKILFKPDKNAPEYKAVVEASRSAQTAPLDLLQRRRRHRLALPVPLEALPVRALPQGHRLSRRCRRRRSRTTLPLADVQAFSVDDSSTTEIDDALSVQGLGSGTRRRRRPHRRARPGAAARQRRSTRWRASACPPSTCRATS